MKGIGIGPAGGRAKCQTLCEQTLCKMQRLLESYGYERSDKGRTSGSRVIFKNGDKRPIMLLKPHPGNIVKGYAMKQVFDDLIEAGYIK